MSEEYVCEARNLTKLFPGVKALEDVTIRLKRGSIHALLGENGAGKSTLIKILTGVLQPNAGDVILNGASVTIADPRAAAKLGIGVVHQERHLIPRFSIAENIMLDRLGDKATSLVDFEAVNAEAAKWLKVLDLDLDPRTPVNRLSVAQMQQVEVAKALSLQSQVLLMDEPTASLTPHETENLFALLKRLRDDGVTIVFVSHKLEEVLSICDSVTVLRDGRNACDSKSLKGVTRADLVQMMIGRSEQIPDWAPRDRSGENPVLELRDVCSDQGHEDINLILRKGEVLGLYGLVGAGRSELAKTIIGHFRVTSGAVLINGKAAEISSVSDALNTYSIGYVSEDRKTEGLVLIHSVIDNAGITTWQRLSNAFGLLTNAKVKKHVTPVITKLEVKTPSLDQYVNNLSGGNQQKVSVGKWLAANVEILIIDEPTVGIDIKTKAYIHELIRDLSDGGTSILLITSDMPEMITVADRILVVDQYRIHGEIINDRDYDRVSAEIMSYIHVSEAAE